MSQTNVRKIVRLKAREGGAAEMREALIELQRETLREPGCVEFQFLQALTVPESFLLIEDFASTEALDSHMQAPHTRRFFATGLLLSGTPIDKAWLS